MPNLKRKRVDQFQKNVKRQRTESTLSQTKKRKKLGKKIKPSTSTVVTIKSKGLVLTEQNLNSKETLEAAATSALGVNNVVFSTSRNVPLDQCFQKLNHYNEKTVNEGLNGIIELLQAHGTKLVRLQMGPLCNTLFPFVLKSCSKKMNKLLMTCFEELFKCFATEASFEEHQKQNGDSSSHPIILLPKENFLPFIKPLTSYVQMLLLDPKNRLRKRCGVSLLKVAVKYFPEMIAPYGPSLFGALEKLLHALERTKFVNTFGKTRKVASNSESLVEKREKEQEKRKNRTKNYSAFFSTDSKGKIDSKKLEADKSESLEIDVGEILKSFYKLLKAYFIHVKNIENQKEEMMKIEKLQKPKQGHADDMKHLTAIFQQTNFFANFAEKDTSSSKIQFGNKNIQENDDIFSSGQDNSSSLKTSQEKDEENFDKTLVDEIELHLQKTGNILANSVAASSLQQQSFGATGISEDPTALLFPEHEKAIRKLIVTYVFPVWIEIMHIIPETSNNDLEKPFKTARTIMKILDLFCSYLEKKTLDNPYLKKKLKNGSSQVQKLECLNFFFDTSDFEKEMLEVQKYLARVHLKLENYQEILERMGSDPVYATEMQKKRGSLFIEASVTEENSVLFKILNNFNPRNFSFVLPERFSMEDIEQRIELLKIVKSRQSKKLTKLKQKKEEEFKKVMMFFGNILKCYPISVSRQLDSETEDVLNSANIWFSSFYAFLLCNHETVAVLKTDKEISAILNGAGENCLNFVSKTFFEYLSPPPGKRQAIEKNKIQYFGMCYRTISRFLKYSFNPSNQELKSSISNSRLLAFLKELFGNGLKSISQKHKADDIQVKIMTANFIHFALTHVPKEFFYSSLDGQIMLKNFWTFLIEVDNTFVIPEDEKTEQIEPEIVKNKQMILDIVVALLEIQKNLKPEQPQATQPSMPQILRKVVEDFIVSQQKKFFSFPIDVRVTFINLFLHIDRYTAAMIKTLLNISCANSDYMKPSSSQQQPQKQQARIPFEKTGIALALNMFRIGIHEKIEMFPENELLYVSYLFTCFKYFKKLGDNFVLEQLMLNLNELENSKEKIQKFLLENK